MFIHAPIATIGTSPEPAVFPLLDRLHKIATDLIRRGFRVSMLAEHDVPEFRFVPTTHIIFPFLLLLFPFPLPCILIQIPLNRLPSHLQIMTEFTLPAFLAAATLLEELAHDGFRVHAEGHLLHLHGLEQLRGFALRGLGGCLFAFARGFFGFFFFLLGGFGGGRLRLDGFDLFLRRGTFFLWEAVGGVRIDFLQPLGFGEGNG